MLDQLPFSAIVHVNVPCTPSHMINMESFSREQGRSFAPGPARSSVKMGERIQHYMKG